MEIFLNTQSIDRQYGSASLFLTALRRIMTMRAIARQFEREIYCDGQMLDRKISPAQSVRSVVLHLPKDQRRTVMQWCMRRGPFWDRARQHDVDDWLECRGEVVTDEALGEAAYRKAMGRDCVMVSFRPSGWMDSPLVVRWLNDDEAVVDEIALDNFWTISEFEHRLRYAESRVSSWEDLCAMAEKRFGKLVFGPHCFRPIGELPFSSAAAKRITALLNILDQFATQFEPDGKRTVEGHRMNQAYFTGSGALFSDSTDREKHKFAKDMKFRHPHRPDEMLSCTWHGKCHYRSIRIRIHFSWPVRANEPVYVMYVGPKITVT